MRFYGKPTSDELAAKEHITHNFIQPICPFASKPLTYA